MRGLPNPRWWGLVRSNVAPTCAHMSRCDPLPDLATANLGDVVELEGSPPQTVRSRVLLPTPVGQMSGFVVLGEFEAVVGFSLAASMSYVLYRRVGSRIPAGLLVRPAYRGVTSFWSPHLPPARSAMGEVPWRVAEVANSFDPLVVLWRSGEPVVFMRDGDLQPGALSMKWMPRDRPDRREFHRSSVEVVAPAWEPSPSHASFQRSTVP